jgi:hypothetical protein
VGTPDETKRKIKARDQQNKSKTPLVNDAGWGTLRVFVFLKLLSRAAYQFEKLELLRVVKGRSCASNVKYCFL